MGLVHQSGRFARSAYRDGKREGKKEKEAYRGEIHTLCPSSFQCFIVPDGNPTST